MATASATAHKITLLNGSSSYTLYYLMHKSREQQIEYRINFIHSMCVLSWHSVWLVVVVGVDFDQSNIVLYLAVAVDVRE